MAYIQREVEKALRKLVNTFKIVLITGPREVCAYDGEKAECK